MGDPIVKDSFICVYECTRKDDQTEFILKNSSTSIAERQSVINECSLIKCLNSPYIVSCEEVYEYERRIWVILEMMQGGDLSKIVK